MKKLFIIAFLPLFLFSQTGMDLKKTADTSFDMTYKNPENKTYESLKDMILVEIGKANILSLRTNKITNCLKDPYSTTYCPELLYPADEYWDHENSISVTRLGTVVDYSKKFKAPK